MFAPFRAISQNGDPIDYSGADLPGPYFSDPALMIALDCPDPVDGQCTGPLHFEKLMRDAHLARFGAKLLTLENKPGANPFKLSEASEIVATIRQELQDIRFGGGNPPGQLDPNFLTHDESRIELVGVVNRMDRQFHSFQTESDCGEISLIYRFSYALTRLPVTLNVVLPAEGAGLNCATAAQRWLKFVDPQSRPSATPDELARLLMAAGSGPLAHVSGGAIARIELNMQTYRKPASADPNDFGSEATYLIRVFRWDGAQGKFIPALLPNEINRSALTCTPADSARLCQLKQADRSKLVAFLQRPRSVAELDNGTLDLPRSLGVLSMRAVTVSPGGAHRSINQPYWNAGTAANGPKKREEVISNAEIEQALARARSAGVALANIGNADDFRMRLNDSTCTGCHQTRAIAGFHFPGRERPGTPPSNSVYLAGSPLFYGDQSRRFEVVRKIAQTGNARLGRAALESSYSARPSEKFGQGLARTQLIGGWGGACLIPGDSPNSKRNWSCRSGLTCKEIFESANAPGMGTCVPDGRMEIGDYLQTGTITTTAFGFDRYDRQTPISKPASPLNAAEVFSLDEFEERLTTIEDRFLPPDPPAGNTYYGSHQEFYLGYRGELMTSLRKGCTASGSWEKCDPIIRDTQTGGFPAGMLRLSECKGLPNEATCALIASTGFNKCLKRFAGFGWPIETCFRYFTAFAGIRACTAATPCRDDYICVNPALENPKRDLRSFWTARLDALRDPSPKNPWTLINNKDPYRLDMFGQQLADDAWIERNDTRGVCIPPYFVFQFRSDGHPPLSVPKALDNRSIPARNGYEREGEI